MASKEIERLISIFARLPGMGERLASRVVVYLLRRKSTVMYNMLRSLETVFNQSRVCEICNNIDTTDVCSICSSQKREQDKVCVVTDLSDMWSIERSGAYRGLYHVMGGRLSAINGMTPEDLDLDKLVKRIRNSNIKEVIIAMDADLDGQTTLFFLYGKLKGLDVSVTTLSHGVPMGGEIEYLDDGTIRTAFNQRRLIENQ